MISKSTTRSRCTKKSRKSEHCNATRRDTYRVMPQRFGLLAADMHLYFVTTEKKRFDMYNR
jgi:hypothetical protein